VLVSAVTPYLMKTDDNSTGVEPSVFEGILSGLAVDRPHFLTGFGQKFFGNSLPNHKVSHEMLQWTLQMAMMGSLRATLECAKSFATKDFRPDMAAFDVTTMIIHGTADETVPIDSSARVAVGLIRNAYRESRTGSTPPRNTG
jgi:non-heme chloroperoxidase